MHSASEQGDSFFFFLFIVLLLHLHLLYLVLVLLLTTELVYLAPHYFALLYERGRQGRGGKPNDEIDEIEIMSGNRFRFCCCKRDMAIPHHLDLLLIINGNVIPVTSIITSSILRSHHSPNIHTHLHHRTKEKKKGRKTYKSMTRKPKTQALALRFPIPISATKGKESKVNKSKTKAPFPPSSNPKIPKSLVT